MSLSTKVSVPNAVEARHRQKRSPYWLMGAQATKMKRCDGNNVNWYVSGTVAPLYSWRMLNSVDAELRLGNEEQQWAIEVNLLDHPFESLRGRGVCAPLLAFLATDPNGSIHKAKGDPMR